MWTCLKCNAVNEDLYPCCPKCGAGKSAGRFGSYASSRPAVYAQRPAEAKRCASPPLPRLVTGEGALCCRGLLPVGFFFTVT